MPSSIPGLVPSLISPPAGCVFHPRCKFAFDRCTAAEPALAEVTPRRRPPASCIRKSRRCPSSARSDAVIRVRGLKVWFSQRRACSRRPGLRGRLGQGGRRDRPRRPTAGDLVPRRGERLVARRRRQGAPATRRAHGWRCLVRDAGRRLPPVRGRSESPGRPGPGRHLGGSSTTYSFTWIPNDPWTPRDILTTTAAIVVAAFSRADGAGLVGRAAPATVHEPVDGPRHIDLIASSSARWDPCRPRDQPDARPAFLALLALVIDGTCPGSECAASQPPSCPSTLGLHVYASSVSRLRGRGARGMRACVGLVARAARIPRAETNR